MFEAAFKKELSVITADQVISGNLWNELKTNYSNPKRYYHTLTHLDNLRAELFAIKEEISDWTTMIFSIAYHDIIYNPLRQDNEEKSAELAVHRLTLLDLPHTQKNKCKDQILATRSHNRSQDNDTNYFTDADLAILGSDPETYKEYTKAIRKEYKLYPDPIYIPGRKNVLNHFLKMPEIYKTGYFKEKYESKARENISNELKELS